jgi:hypothetical protein
MKRRHGPLSYRTRRRPYKHSRCRAGGVQQRRNRKECLILPAEMAMVGGDRRTVAHAIDAGGNRRRDLISTQAEPIGRSRGGVMVARGCCTLCFQRFLLLGLSSSSLTIF